MTNWISGPNAPLGQITPAGVEDTPRAKIGSVAKFYDSDGGGEGEFIYLPGVAGTVNGDLVSYSGDPANPVTIRYVAGVAASSGRPLAVACAAAGANQYTWYQISGLAIVNAVAGAIAGPMFATATPGAVGSAADAGDQILGARLASAVGVPSAGKAYASLARPFAQGQIT